MWHSPIVVIIEMNIQKDEGVYVEPKVWMQHFIS